MSDTKRVLAHSLKIPAHKRLSILRELGQDHGTDWRAQRWFTLQNYETAFGFLSTGLQDKQPIWYTQAGPYFQSREKSLLDLPRGHRKNHSWYTNADNSVFKDGSGLAQGIIVYLPHGRFLAGYHWGDNNERVYFPEIYTDIEDAISAADSHAETFATSQRENDEKFQAMILAELKVENLITEVEKAFYLRHKPKFGGKDRVHKYLGKLRKARDELDEAIKTYEGP